MDRGWLVPPTAEHSIQAINGVKLWVRIGGGRVGQLIAKCSDAVEEVVSRRCGSRLCVAELKHV